MGTYLWSYAVDLEKLSAAFGSADTRLAKRATAKARVEHNTEWFAREINAGAPKLDRAIAEVVDGKLTARKHAFQYVYALEALCRVLGTNVSGELKVGEWIEKVLDPLLEKVGEKDFCRLMHIHKPRAPVRIPQPRDYPACTFLTPAEVVKVSGIIARVEDSARSTRMKPDHVETLEYVLGDLNGRLQGARKRRRGLVNFLY